jgi:tetratricopeptide (TPR) repeat protein
MIKHRLFSYFLILSGILLVFSGSVFSQTTAPVRGVVFLQSDGKRVPVADALVEPYRIDIDSGKSPSTKTNKNGEFSFVGFPLGQKYVLAVSGASISPAVSPTIQGGMESVEIQVFPGDGKAFTEAEVRSAAKSNPKGVATASEADRKKAEAEYQKQLAKYNEEKAKAENANKIVNAAMKDGDAAFKAKDYAAAIAKFDEGIAADPDFEGSAPVLLNYKGVVLKTRGFEAYQRAAKADAAGKAAEMEKAKADFQASLDAYDRALKVLASAPKAADAATQANLDKTKFMILGNFIESYRLIVRTKADPTKAKDAGPVYAQYLAVETDPAKKLSAQLALGDIMREAGESEPAIAAYRAVLESQPENPDALAGIGLSLFNVGVVENDKAKMQEGLNIMTKFADTAPETHPLKSSVKEAVEYLKTEQKLAPQKTTTPPRRRP